jgi:hypothetical protein
MRRRGLALAALVLALAPAAPARAGEMFGVNVNRVFNDDFTPANWDAPLAAVRESGIRVARSDAFWMWAEPHAPEHGDHDYTWNMLDAEATALARHGLRWRPILDYSAHWAVGGADYHSPPASNDDYAAYARAFARRYGRGGSFWAEHPELTALPVTAYEIWNEPDNAAFWRPGPDPARYADMYLRARGAIREADEHATVVVGGLLPDTGYVTAMYAAHPQLRGNVDAIGFHPYAPTADRVLASVRALSRTLVDVGDPSVPIHITEVGWPTRGAGLPIVLGEADRAAALGRVADALARSDCGVAAVLAYTWTTPQANPADVEDWYGIRNADGSATATSDAFAGVVARWDEQPVTPASRERLCSVIDSDGDGAGDTEDPDDDNDGTPDVADKFRTDPRESADLDGDGIGNSADGDDDNDGALDVVELLRGSSPRDLDSDDDGLSDAVEISTSPATSDSDRDGLSDGLERGVTRPVADPPGAVGATDPKRFRPDLDPITKTSAVRADSDRDGLADGREDRTRDGSRHRRETDPLARDTDRDGVGDRLDRRPLDRRRR